MWQKTHGKVSYGESGITSTQVSKDNNQDSTSNTLNWRLRPIKTILAKTGINSSLEEKRRVVKEMKNRYGEFAEFSESPMKAAELAEFLRRLGKNDRSIASDYN
ncbi:hypothetical protein HELRODRAFT_175728 [Helobdella robusta]|uniref:Uncharacterized protein n=1 Tax=Helobdella robusta TaxID=6412 RepID=T1F9L1_HELRO|nr:hypothetical protein HELRODRAFT_175728 [Helobdella robusta]ESO00333.1 hypothetical protein HELRODRAFT_175728 [Helobdella robusta]